MKKIIVTLNNNIVTLLKIITNLMKFYNILILQIDCCNRLWVLDNGQIGQKQICSPQVLVFDLATNKLLKRVKVPIKFANNFKTKMGKLVTIVVETHGPFCTNTIVSMPIYLNCRFMHIPIRFLLITSIINDIIIYFL